MTGATAPVLFALLMSALAGSAAEGQVLHASGPLPSFEVVSIKLFQPKPMAPAPPGEQIIHQETVRIAPKPMRRQMTDHVRFILSPQMLIEAAYNLQIGEEYRVVGGPDWAHSQQYVVDARIDEASFAAIQKLPPEQQKQQVALMEQSLLAERFHLKVHFENRMAPGLALRVAKGGTKLAPGKEGAIPAITMVNDQMSVQNSTIDEWIHTPFLAGREIVDKTGLTGHYDFTLTFSDRVSAEGVTDGPPPFATAVEEQLGLKLEHTKVPLEYVVIDQIEQPTEN